MRKELSFLIPALVDRKFKKCQIFTTSRSLSDFIGKIGKTSLNSSIKGVYTFSLPLCFIVFWKLPRKIDTIDENLRKLEPQQKQRVLIKKMSVNVRKLAIIKQYFSCLAHKRVATVRSRCFGFEAEW